MKEKRVGIRWWRVIGWGLVALIWPGVALGAAVTYGLLRKRWPDRLVAWFVGGAGLVGAVALVWLTDYLRRWAVVASWWLADGRRPTGQDWTVITVTALVGPALGAAWWGWRQWQRERAPFAGRLEREAREAAEGRRRQVVLRAAQRARHEGPRGVRSAVRPFTVAPAADPVGPRLGVVLAGDLGGGWRAGAGKRQARLPMNDPANRHLVLLGATGMGKTETVCNVLEWAAKEGWQTGYITAKEPPDVTKSLAPRMAAIADRSGQRLRVLTAGLSPYDPMRGSLDEQRDRLIRIQAWGDEYWAHCANLLIGLALDLSAEAGESVDSLAELVYRLLHGKLKEMAGTSRDARVSELVAALDNSALSGALMRFASLALHLRGWTAPRAGNGWSWEDADIACVELPTVSRPEAGSALLRLMMRDLSHYIASGRRQRLADGRARPALFVVEEIGAVAADPVLEAEFVGFVERARSAGVYLVMSAQDPLGLGGDRAQAAILTNCTVASYRQTTAAEAVAKLAGTYVTAEAGADYDQHGRYADQGVVRMQDAFKVNPQVMRELRQGELVVISAGRWLKVAGAMGADGYGLPAIEAVQRTVDQVNAGVQLLALPPAPLPPIDGVPGPRDGDGDQISEEG